MRLTDSIHHKRVVVAGAVIAAGLGVGLFVPSLLDAEAEPSRPPVTTPDNQPGTEPAPGALADGRYAGAITAAYVGPAELVFTAQGGDTGSLAVSGDVVVTTRDPSGNPVAIDYDSFTLFIDRGDGAASVFDITIEDGVVVEIHEQAER